MQEMISGLMAKVGLSKEQAEKVQAFLLENASSVTEWLGKSGKLKDIAGKLPGFPGGKTS